MNAHQLLHKLAARGVTRDQARVLISLSTRGKTIHELQKENPHLSRDVVEHMHGPYLKRVKLSRSYIYRLTEAGMNTVKMIFDEETTPEVNHLPDSPPLPFPQTA
jgi:hypothetical protein